MTLMTHDAAESPLQQQTTTSFIGDVTVNISKGRAMATYVALTFDNLSVNASKQLTNATLLLHNNPVIKQLSDVVKIYSNTSQIIQIEVR